MAGISKPGLELSWRAPEKYDGNLVQYNAKAVKVSVMANNWLEMFGLEHYTRGF